MASPLIPVSLTSVDLKEIIYAGFLSGNTRIG